MGIQRNTYVIYGVPVDTDDWLALEEDPGQCRNDGKVGYFSAGAYDRDMYFLAMNWKELEPGEFQRFSCNEVMLEYAYWDGALASCAERLGLTTLEAPGWYVLPDES